jgi:hypothetical protein
MTFIDSINFLFLFVIKHFKESSRIKIGLVLPMPRCLFDEFQFDSRNYHSIIRAYSFEVNVVHYVCGEKPEYETKENKIVIAKYLE